MADKRQRDMQNLSERGLKWVPDPDENQCTNCLAEFSLLNRRHHCRVCGHIFCDDCCHSLNAYPDVLKHTERVRTCKNCEARGGKIEDGGVVVQTFTVVGYQDCPNHQKVADLLAILVGKYPTHLRGEIVGADSKEEYEAWLQDKTQKLGITHTTSPICFLGTEDDGEYLGGADEFIAYLGQRFAADVGKKNDGGCMIQ